MTDPEAAVLGACLLDASAYWRCADVLVEDDFAKGSHRRLWALIVTMFREGGAVDAVTVGERDAGLGDLAFECGSHAGATANARTYAEIVAKRATERRVIAAGQRITGLRGDDVLGEAQRILAAASPQNSTAVRHIKSVLAESSKVLVQRYECGEALTGLATSLPGLDDTTSGLQRADLLILAARPSVGKTALAIQMALHAAMTATPVLFFSAEMMGRQLADRMLAHLSHVSLKAIRSPRLIEDEGWAGISRATADLQNLPLWIDDSSAMTVEMIAARARQIDAQQRLGLIVVDYLTHLRLPKADRRDIAVGEATRALKALAKGLNVPVLLLSQLNRGAADTRPHLKDLRDSGDIEQDADVVIFLHRPDESRREHLELIVAKQRNGECATHWLNADMARMRFTETDEPQHEPEQQRRSGFRGRGFGAARDRAAGTNA